VQLLELVVSRLVCVNFAPLVSGLLVALSQMTRMHAGTLIEALAAMTVTLPGEMTGDDAGTQ
jgi:hypothetical protein